MSTDLETRLRKELHTTAVPDLELDLDQIVGAGQRVVRRRALLGGGFAAAVLAGVGAAVLAPKDRQPGPIPGAPSSTATEAGWFSIDLPRIVDRNGKVQADEPVAIRVQVHPSPLADESEPNLRYQYSQPDGTFTGPVLGSSLPDSGATFGGGSMFPRLKVGVVVGPAVVLGYVGVTDMDFIVRRIPDTNYWAFAFRDPEDTFYPRPVGLLWTTPDNQVRSMDTTSPPWALIKLGPVQVFHDRVAGYLGYVENGRMATYPDSAARARYSSAAGEVLLVTLPVGSKNATVTGKGWSMAGFQVLDDESWLLAAIAADADPTGTVTYDDGRGGRQSRSIG